jgi:hypothetical protein
MRMGLVTALVLTAAPPVAAASPSVAVSSSAAAGGLVLDGEGGSLTHVVKIADVTLSTDARMGLTVSITAGVLTTSNGRTPVRFQVLLVPRGGAAPPPAAFTTPSTMIYVWSTTAPGAVDKDLYIKYTPARLQSPGAYTANVDIDVTNNEEPHAVPTSVHRSGSDHRR